MISFKTIFIILTVHTIFDFFLQNRWMGENKSKFSILKPAQDCLPLLAHISIYTLGLIFIAVTLNFDFGKAYSFVLFNGVAHFLTDLITSKISSKFYKENKLQAFWNTIGIDKFIHLIVLFALAS